MQKQSQYITSRCCAIGLIVVNLRKCVKMHLQTLNFGVFLIIVLIVAQQAACGYSSSLEEKYNFFVPLNTNPDYKLYWSLEKEDGSDLIKFAVNVSTTGWVGFGLSPNGQMPGSDVIMAWVDSNGKVKFNDRYASGRYQPEIDESADWTMTHGEVVNGNTILEFHRKLVTCDEKDMDITTSTSQVIWSISNSTSLDSPHQHKGQRSINFLGVPRETDGGQNENENSFNITTNNTQIPSQKTTYWCTIVELPTEKRYIHRISPVINVSDGNKDLIHHMLIYQCPYISNNEASLSTNCDDPSLPLAVKSCRGIHILAGWAIGGQDFIYPKDVAYEVGGEDYPFRYCLLEIHYNNAKISSGVQDSSGLQFFYTTLPPIHFAGIMAVGHHVSSNMLIPPNSQQYNVSGHCSGKCTEKFIRKEGITVFGGLLHTHLAGRSLVLKHYRHNSECDVMEELQPIDVNINYDVDYQQVNIYPREVKVFPGDNLQLECTYDTTNRSQVTLGGEGTNDEMCLTFLFYYPRQKLSLCSSMPEPKAAYTFLSDMLPKGAYDNLTALLQSSFLVTEERSNKVHTILNEIDWPSELVSNMQQTLIESPSVQVCVDDFSNFVTKQIRNVTLPKVHCDYVPSHVCNSGYKPESCCSRIKSGSLPQVTKQHNSDRKLALIIHTIIIAFLTILKTF